MGCSLRSDLHLNTLSTRTQSQRLSHEKHPTRDKIVTLLIVVNVLEFHIFCLWVWRQAEFSPCFSVLSGNAFNVFCTSLSPRRLWAQRVGGRLDGAEPQCVRVKGSHVLCILLCFGAFTILLTVRSLQTIVRGSLLSAIKNSLLAHTNTLKIFNTQLR